jgi:hypothetical protein
MKRTTGAVIARAAASLIMAGLVPAWADQPQQKPADEQVMCQGVRKGVVSLTQAECQCKGGTVTEKKAAAD